MSEWDNSGKQGHDVISNGSTHDDLVVIVKYVGKGVVEVVIDAWAVRAILALGLTKAVYLLVCLIFNLLFSPLTVAAGNLPKIFVGVDRVVPWGRKEGGYCCVSSVSIEVGDSTSQSLLTFVHHKVKCLRAAQRPRISGLLVHILQVRVEAARPVHDENGFLLQRRT